MRKRKVFYLVLLFAMMICCFMGCKDKNEEKQKKKDVKKEKQKKVDDNLDIKSNAFLITYKTTNSDEEVLRTCMCFAEITDLVKENRKTIEKITIQDVHIIGNDVNYDKELDFSYMFKDCKQIKEVDFSLMSNDRVTKTENMFANCVNLEKVYVSDKWNLKNTPKAKSMFKNCTKLNGKKKFDEKDISSKYATYKNGYFTYKDIY